jgi:hypothetical protein
MTAANLTTPPPSEFQKALSARAARLLKVWPPPKGPVPLRDSHRLLDQQAIEDALITCMVERSKMYSLAWPPRRGDGYAFPHHPVLLPYLRQWVIDRVRNGRLFARGLDPAKILTGKPINIPADRLNLLTFDFERSTASLNGHAVMYEITIEAPPSDRPRPASRASISEWFAAYAARCETEGKFPDQNLAWADAQSAFPGLKDRSWFRKLYARRTGRGRGRPKAKK